MQWSLRCSSGRSVRCPWTRSRCRGAGVVGTLVVADRGHGHRRGVLAPARRCPRGRSVPAAGVSRGAPATAASSTAHPTATVVRAVAAGEVTFSGTVAGERYVVVRHADGRRATYGNLASSSLGTGDVVAAGSVVGVHRRPSALRPPRGRARTSTPPRSSDGSWGGHGWCPTTAPPPEPPRRRACDADDDARRRGRVPGLIERGPMGLHCSPGASLGAPSYPRHIHLLELRSSLGAPRAGAVNRRGDSDGRHHDASDARSRCPFRAPDPPVEPQDEAIHLR